jgi:protein-tyrosine phosphatase
MMRTVLFLCTGNYYRSRVAEELFTHHAPRAGLRWVARSRALAIERGIDNVGSLSPVALRALEKRGLVAKDSQRSPQQCAVVDLESADLIVALMDSEHRPLIRERFSNWEHRIEYWQVGDVNVTRSDAALSSIETEIAALIERLVHSRIRTLPPAN